MSDHPDQGSATTSEVDDEFERLGRTAGSELRTPPPRDGHRLVERTSYVRRATLATLTVGTTLAVVTGAFPAGIGAGSLTKPFPVSGSKLAPLQRRSVRGDRNWLRYRGGPCAGIVPGGGVCPAGAAGGGE